MAEGYACATEGVTPEMIDLIDGKGAELHVLCGRYHVRALELFGSAATGEFDAHASDLDFLVTFEELEPGQHADAYFGLLEALEALFGRPVDLVMTTAVTNPYFLRSIEATRTLLYAA